MNTSSSSSPTRRLSVCECFVFTLDKYDEKGAVSFLMNFTQELADPTAFLSDPFANQDVVQQCRTFALGTQTECCAPGCRRKPVDCTLLSASWHRDSSSQCASLSLQQQQQAGETKKPLQVRILVLNAAYCGLRRCGDRIRIHRLRPELNSLLGDHSLDCNGSKFIIRQIDRCTGCQQPAEKIWYCSKCRVAAYCSRNCQLGDFHRHKKECLLLYAGTFVTAASKPPQSRHFPDEDCIDACHTVASTPPSTSSPSSVAIFSLD